MTCVSPCYYLQENLAKLPIWLRVVRISQNLTFPSE